MTSVSKTHKRLKVVAAVIVKENKIFCAKRAYGFLEGKFEFPGGKVEKGETSEVAIHREIKEELNTEIQIDSFLCTVVYDYPTFTLDMDVFIVHLTDSELEIEKTIHTSGIFQTVEAIGGDDWCPADSIVAKKLKEVWK